MSCTEVANGTPFDPVILVRKLEDRKVGGLEYFGLGRLGGVGLDSDE